VSDSVSTSLRLRYLGVQPYQPVWQAMSAFTNSRNQSTVDELWLVQHEPVFTQGQAGKAEHLLALGDIPLVQSDRGGQVTYHGPGQLIVYPLIDLRRRKIGVRDMVTLLETVAVELLASYHITAYAKRDAPGVYLRLASDAEAKIASLGLRVRKGCCFHGMSINVAMDMAPFARINPCGYSGLAMTQLKDHLVGVDYTEVEASVIQLMANKLHVSNLISDETDYCQS